MSTSSSQPAHHGRGKKQPKQLPRWARRLLTVLVIVGAVALIIGMLPSGGFSTDLSRIGQGQPVGVVIHEPANPTSMGVMDMLRELDGETSDRITFLVASLGQPEGEQFARHFRVESAGLMVFFDGDGQPVEVRRPENPADVMEMVEALAPR